MRGNSYAQPFLVDLRDSLVGTGKTIPRFVDLPLGEILDHEQVLYGIARLAQFAVGRYERATVDHKVSLLGCFEVELVNSAGSITRYCARTHRIHKIAERSG